MSSVNKLGVNGPGKLLLQEDIRWCHKLNPVFDRARGISAGAVQIVVDGEVLLTIAVNFLGNLLRLLVLVDQFLALLAKCSHVGVDVFHLVVLGHGLEVFSAS